MGWANSSEVAIWVCLLVVTIILGFIYVKVRRRR